MKKILFVEDDIFLLRVYKLRLEELGYKIIILENGLKVNQIVKKEKPDLIILDIVMPEIDGFEVLKRLKSDKQLNKIPVMILSGLNHTQDVEEGMKLGAIDFIKKDLCTFNDVISKIESFFKKNI